MTQTIRWLLCVLLFAARDTSYFKKFSFSVCLKAVVERNFSVFWRDITGYFLIDIVYSKIHPLIASRKFFLFQMAGTYDSEQQRMIDRIKCIAFREACDAGATFINRQWIADKIHRTTRFVSECWEKSYDQCFADYSNAGPKLKLSQAAQDIIREASGRQRKSGSVVAKEIAEKQKEYVTRQTVNNYRHREGLKPFHVIPKPLKSETHISDRLWLCDWLKDWTEEDFLNLAPSDEFYVWTVRRPNYQNDRVWAKSIEDIEDDERYREIVKNQVCIGIFIIFTAKKLHWVIKDKGESWTG
jgi:hypothetical protein